MLEKLIPGMDPRAKKLLSFFVLGGLGVVSLCWVALIFGCICYGINGRRERKGAIRIRDLSDDSDSVISAYRSDVGLCSAMSEVSYGPGGTLGVAAEPKQDRRGRRSRPGKPGRPVGDEILPLGAGRRSRGGTLQARGESPPPAKVDSPQLVHMTAAEQAARDATAAAEAADTARQTALAAIKKAAGDSGQQLETLVAAVAALDSAHSETAAAILENTRSAR